MHMNSVSISLSLFFFLILCYISSVEKTTDHKSGKKEKIISNDLQVVIFLLLSRFLSNQEVVWL